MTLTPAHNPSATQTAPEPSLYSRKNYVVFVAEGGLLMSGMAFVSQDSILPGIVRQLGGSDTLLAFIPMLMMMGFTLPPLLTAGWIERQGHLMPMLRIFGMLQRAPYLLAFLVLWGLGASHPKLALWSVVAAPVLCGLVGGITLGAWMRLTSRTVAGRRRSSGSALRNLTAALFGMFVGLLVEGILARVPGMRGFAILHGICFLFLTASYLVFLFTREPPTETPPVAHHRSFPRQLQWMFNTLKVDPPFRIYIISRVCNAFIFISIPFLAVTALDITGRPESFTGRLLSCQMAGAILGNLLGGWVGDLKGSRQVLLMARVAFLSLAVLTLITQSAAGFAVAFVFWGCTAAMQQIGEQTFMVEFAREKRLPSYFAVVSFVQLLSFLMVGGLSSTLRHQGVGIRPLLLISMLGTGISLVLLLLKIKEPRE